MLANDRLQEWLSLFKSPDAIPIMPIHDRPLRSEQSPDGPSAGRFAAVVGSGLQQLMSSYTMGLLHKKRWLTTKNYYEWCLAIIVLHYNHHERWLIINRHLPWLISMLGVNHDSHPVITFCLQQTMNNALRWVFGTSRVFGTGTETPAAILCVPPEISRMRMSRTRWWYGNNVSSLILVCRDIKQWWIRVWVNTSYYKDWVGAYANNSITFAV